MGTLKKVFGLFLIVITTYISLFSYIINVKANSVVARITGDGVNLRKNATTKNSDILTTLNEGDKINIIDSKLVSGTGCDKGWYKITYNNITGYVCSKYVSTDFSDSLGRPWNTPKKAIVGGAKFISNGYIAKGQFTSYLKKFNVNPNGSYKMFNHLYQANIQAPYSEALMSSTSYYKNGGWNLPFNFSIPVYENMKDSYPHPIKSNVNLSTTDKTDDKFEKMIKDFPDSYKPYLRQLHQEHNNWTFTPMKTGITLEEAANNFKLTGAINSTDKRLTELDAKGNPVATNEKGWYRPNLAITKFYLDPRNFLNESFVFMFENLSYIEVKESVIQGVLNKKSFISGMDLIDNQSYASIFIEAGKTTNVNPVYLASLAVQEIGKFNTTGQEFEYEGKTYSGLFNFFNIGAYSSASNPVKAGLVYASGGLCTKCATYNSNSSSNTNNNNNNNSKTNEKKEEQKPTYNPQTTINNLGAKVNSSYISGFNVGTAISTLKAKDSNATYSNNDVVKTGQTITLANGTTYTVVIYGDLTGDGQINSADLLKMRQYLLGSSSLSGAYLESAKVTGNSTINSANLLKIRQYLLGKTNISQK